MATVKYGALEISPAPLVGINIQSKYFGADIRYSSAKVYSLQGTILSSLTSGISGIHTQQESIATGFAQSYLPFSIDDRIIGYPRVNSLSFDVGTWVQRQNYNIELEFLESGTPFQFTGINYNLTGVSGLFHNVESLSESLDYDTDFRKYSYTHNIEIQYRSGFNIDPFLNAKIIASGLLNNKTVFPFITSGGPSGVKTYEERQNIFDGSYGVTEKFEGTTGNLTYEHLYSLNLSLEENGIITTTQQGVVRGLGTNRYPNAKDGYNEIRPLIYPNCSGFYGVYSEDGTLNQTYLADRRTDDISNGVVNYSRSFTNESGLSNVRWRYSHEITRDENYFSASERGNIIGMGHISTRFAQASGEWLTVESGIEGRIFSFFSGFGGTGALFNTSRERGFDRFNGSIDYNYGYSNAAGLGVGSGIKSFEVTVDDVLPIADRVYIAAIGVGVLAQSLNRTKQCERNVNVNVQAFRDTTYPNRFDFTKNKINEHRPLDAHMIDPFLNSLEVTYSPQEATLEARANYIFGGYTQDLKLSI